MRSTRSSDLIMLFLPMCPLLALGLISGIPAAGALDAIASDQESQAFFWLSVSTCILVGGLLFSSVMHMHARDKKGDFIGFGWTMLLALLALFSINLFRHILYVLAVSLGDVEFQQDASRTLRIMMAFLLSVHTLFSIAFLFFMAMTVLYLRDKLRNWRSVFSRRWLGNGIICCAILVACCGVFAFALLFILAGTSGEQATRDMLAGGAAASLYSMLLLCFCALLPLVCLQRRRDP